MAYCNLDYSGSSAMGISAYVTEVTDSGTQRTVRLELTAYAADGFTGRRDAAYSVSCQEAGVSETVPMYSGFWISGTEATFFDETFTVYLPAGTSEAEISLNFTVSMYSSAAGGTVKVTGSVTGLYLSVDSESETLTPSGLLLYDTHLALGQVLSIAVLPVSAGYTHELWLYVDGINRGLIAENVSSSYEWKVSDLSALFSSTSLSVCIRCETYTESGSYAGYTEKTVTLTLPSATAPKCAATAVMGELLTLTLEKGLSGYTHSVEYAFAETGGQIASDAGTSCQWQIPLSLAAWIPDLQKETCTIVCTTLLRGIVVGVQETSVILQVPDTEETKPEASMVLSPEGELPGDFSGMYIQGKTGIRADFTASSQYSSVEAYEIQVEDSRAVGNPAIIGTIHGSGTLTVIGRIRDARGYVRELRQSVYFTGYDKPRVVPYPGENTVTAVRCNTDGSLNPLGQSLLLRAQRTYTALEGNSCTLQYRLKPAAAEEFGEYVALLRPEDPGDQVSVTAVGVCPDVKTGYTVQLRAIDALESYTVLTVPVGAAEIPLHIGKGSGNVAVGKYCDYSRENAFEIGLKTYFDTGAAARRIFSEGQWLAGTELGSTVADAEVSAVGSYSIFLAQCKGLPVLLGRLGDRLSGTGLLMTYSDGTLTLDQAEDAVTALYALL